MAVQRYEISLQVLYSFQHEKRIFVSPSGHEMFIYYTSINTNEIPNHFTLIFFVVLK